MKNYKDFILFGVSGLFVGMILTGLVAGYSVNNNNTGMMRMMGINTSSASGEMIDNSMSDHGGMSMESMSDTLDNKTGNSFDKAFLAEMIDHHQGAIDMANAAKKNAKHDEIKQMADDIITAQSKEIKQMRAWQSAWGY